MTSITCFIVHLDPGFTPAVINYANIAALYRNNSAVFDPAGDIQLTFSVPNSNLTYPGVVNADTLHMALAALTRNGTNRPINRIGLLFARSYWRHPGLFGIMFDRGFRALDDQTAHDLYYQIPREGCAVFLEPLYSRFGSDDDLYRREVAYTIVHELGHVFNLTHYNDDTTRTPAHGTYMALQGGAHFSARQQNWLSSCSRSLAVHPGGTYFRDVEAYRKVKNAKGLKMRVELARNNVFSFEPFELDILLTNRTMKSSIPNEIDPGYANFKLWITEPDGTKRLYHSPRHYCVGEQQRLPQGEFRRDISIFGESGGYTFTTPGNYSIAAEFFLGKRQKIVSNRVELTVMPWSKEAERLALLSTIRASRLFYYRAAPARSPVFKELNEFMAANPRAGSVGTVAYSSGRAYIRIANQLQSKQSRSSAMRKASELLRRAEQHKAIGNNARRRATNYLDAIKQGASADEMLRL